MSSTRLNRIVSALGLALITSLAALAPARAAVVVASFDPAFGAGIPNLGFKGSANLDIADTCFSNAGLVVNGEAGCVMSVLSAQVEFYNLATPETVFSTLNFDGSSFFYFNVLAGFFDGGQLTGLDTQISSPEEVTLINGTGPTAVNFEGFLALDFFTGLLETDRLAARGFVPGIGGARLTICSDQEALDSEVPYCAATEVNDISNPATLQFSTVPEPGSIALALLALGAAGAAGSRRARKAS